MNNDDNNMNDLLKKAQEMINNNQVPDSIKEMMKNINSTNPANSVNSTNFSSSPTPENNSSNIPNFDPQTINQIKNIMGNFNSTNNNNNDDMSRLLLALKPYLRDKKQGKIDNYINLIKMGKMAKLFDLMGGDSK